MAIITKNSYKIIAFFFTIIAINFLFVNKTEARIWATVTDLTTETTTECGYAGSYYSKNMIQTFTMPASGKIISISLRGFYYDEDLIEEKFYMQPVATKDTLPNGGNDHWRLVSSGIPATLGIFTGTVPESSYLNTLSNNFTKGQTIAITHYVKGNGAGIKARYTMETPSSTYASGTAWIQSTLQDLDWQMIVTIDETPMDNFYVWRPYPGEVLPYNLTGINDHSTSTAQINCYSSTSLIAITHEFEAIPTIDQFQQCAEYDFFDPKIFLDFEVKDGAQNLLVYDSNYLDVSISDYLITVPYVGRNVNETGFTDSFYIRAPSKTGKTGQVEKYFDLYDHDSDGFFTFIFNVKNERQSIGDIVDLAEGWRLKIYQFLTPTGSSTLFYDELLTESNMSVTEKMVSVPIAVSSTMIFYRAELWKGGEFTPLGWVWTPTILFVTQATTTRTENNQYRTDETFDYIMTQEEENNFFVCDRYDCAVWPLSNIADCFMQGLCIAFIPDQEQSAEITSNFKKVSGDFLAVAPWGYLPLIAEKLTPTTTQSSTWYVWHDFYIFGYLRLVTGIFTYFALLIYIFKRLRKFWD